MGGTTQRGAVGLFGGRVEADHVIAGPLAAGAQVGAHLTGIRAGADDQHAAGAHGLADHPRHAPVEHQADQQVHQRISDQTAGITVIADVFQRQVSDVPPDEKRKTDAHDHRNQTEIAVPIESDEGIEQRHHQRKGKGDQQDGRRDDLGQRTDAGQRTGQRGRRQQRGNEAQQTVSEQLDEVRSRRSVLENSKHSDSPLGKTLAMRLASLAQDWRPSLLTP